MSLTISLCFICDEQYVMPTAVAITSVISNKNSADHYDIYVITNHISDESVDVFKQLETESGRIIIIESKDSEKYEKFKMKHFHVTTTDLLKFELPYLLPDDLDKVLYLDGDVIVQKDLTPLFIENIEDVYAGAIKDYYVVFNPDNFQKRLNVKHKDYFNAGVLLLNLKKLRDDNIPELLFRHRNSHDDKYMDQDTFNVILRENVKYLSFYCNLQYHCWIYDTKDLAEYYGIKMANSKFEWIKDALVIHYTWLKPWKHADYFAADIWLYYYLQSPFKNAALKRDLLNEDPSIVKVIAELRLTIKRNKAALLKERDNSIEKFF